MPTQLFDGSKSIPIDRFPAEAWSVIAGNREPNEAQKYADAVAYLYRAIEVRANALVSVPWKIYRGNSDTVLWASEDENPPDPLMWAQDLPLLLWRTSIAWSFYNEAFWQKEKNRVRVLSLRWLDPDSMTPKWDKKAGLIAFERKLGEETITFAPEEIVYAWKQGIRETTPAVPPAQAAMQAAGVLYNADAFAAGFFERGAIKATLLTIDGNPSDNELKRLESWWKRFFSGVKDAWSTAAVRADVKAVPVGEGLESLTNATLTPEKREDIATALGVPHSMIMSNAANYATADMDKRTFYDVTVVPDCLLLQRQLNRQLFGPMGYRLSFDPQEMAVYQEDESKRSAAFAAYVGAGLPLSMVAEMLGLYIPDDMEYSDLDKLNEPDPVSVSMAPAQTPDAPVPDSQTDGQRADEIKRFRRWMKKRPTRNPSDFDSDILTEGERVAIAAMMRDEAQSSETGSSFRHGDAVGWESYP